MSIKKIITYILFLGIGVYLLYRRFNLIPTDKKTELFDNMANAPLFAVGITFIMGLLAVISRGIRWNDDLLAIRWPLVGPKISEMDLNQPALEECENPFHI